jgi:ferrous iron transport protein A
MNAPAHFDVIGLDRLKVGTRARVVGVDWPALDEGEACRLKHFGFEEDVIVEPLHLGPFGRDPIAVRVGRMTVAIRRRHAGAISVTPLSQ